ncbi:MFS transporter [Pseudarthrobacter raffinosi]|uniref:MFS transporter n=1 Tax=Pseudarthrobacter raffinosi TaxID=2953651 RepID=UPI00208F48DB|nr:MULTISPECIES: MFS transporter [unclassified Pseudarthrobacter]MCO4251600.1 MFS transporter [Pseudarthrobacter sp. MDT3-9]MCO4264551.1 MFS transporter [Pseudarthrobacter sp. MDT3-26]
MGAATQTAEPDAKQEGRPRGQWGALVFLALAQFMVVLDGTIVNLALPRLQIEMGVSDTTRSWVVTAYALVFGAFLLLGGRVADFWGRKRTFIVAAAGFAIASLAGGIAQEAWELIGARALQGLFAALLAPAALALLTVSFPGGKDRGTAFAIFGSISGVGAAVGVLLGGFLTDYMSWRWTFFVNVPIAIIALVGVIYMVRESKAAGPAKYDWPGVVLAALGLGSLVYGFTNAEHGWGAPEARGFIFAGVVLLVLFVAVEKKVKHPLLPLRVATERNRAAAFLAAFLSGAVLIGGILFINFYIQIVLGFAPFIAGIASLPMTVVLIVTAALVAKNLPKLGAKIPTAVGPAFMAAAMLWLTQVTAEGTYAVNMLPALILMGIGLGMVFVPMQNLALFSVDKDDAGVASALVNASQQIGGSLGIALFSTIAAAATAAAGAAGGSQMVALSAGYSSVFLWAAGVAILIAPLALLLITITRETFSGSDEDQPIHLG